MTDKPQLPTLDEIGPPGADDAPALAASPRPRGRGRRKPATGGDESPSPAAATRSSTDKPPRKARGAGSTATAARVSTKIRQLLSTIGGLFAAAGHEVPARVLIGDKPMIALNGSKDAADAFSDAWGKLAAENPRVRRAIEGLNAGGTYGEVILATAGLLLPIAASYGLLPPRLMAMLFPKSTVDAPSGAHNGVPPIV
jgi:hypothetical protein